jgi:hypothetical protein
MQRLVSSDTVANIPLDAVLAAPHRVPMEMPKIRISMENTRPSFILPMSPLMIRFLVL